MRIVRESPNSSELTLTLGRVPQNDLVLNDPEVSGKHGLISWNPKVTCKKVSGCVQAHLFLESCASAEILKKFWCLEASCGKGLFGFTSGWS